MTILRSVHATLDSTVAPALLVLRRLRAMTCKEAKKTKKTKKPLLLNLRQCYVTGALARQTATFVRSKSSKLLVCCVTGTFARSKLLDFRQRSVTGTC